MKIQHSKISGAQLSLRGKFIALNAYIRKEEKSQISNLSSQLKNLEKEKQNKPRAKAEGRRYHRPEIHETEKRKTIQKTDAMKSWFFEKIDKLPARQTKKK